MKNAIIFCNRKRDVGTVFRSLKKHGFNAGELHGDMDQRQRTLTLDGFRSGEIMFLVASDVAARGLDIPEVSHVFNYDVPTHAEDYIHRIGRTGRAGREGYAATLVTDKEMPAIRDIEKLVGGQIEWLGGPDPSAGEDGKTPGRAQAVGSGRRRGGKAARKGDGEDKASPASTGRAESGYRARPGEDAKPGRKRGRRGGKRQKAEAQTEQHAASDENPKNAQRKPPEAGSEETPKRPRRGRKRELEAAMLTLAHSTAFGMSDQVPAFLMRPIRRASSDS